MVKLIAPSVPQGLREKLLAFGFVRFSVRAQLVRDGNELIEADVTIDQCDADIAAIHDRWESVLLGEYPNISRTEPSIHAPNAREWIAEWFEDEIDELIEKHAPAGIRLEFAFKYDLLRKSVHVETMQTVLKSKSNYTHLY